MQNRKKNSSETGRSLLELIAVVAIIGLLGVTSIKGYDYVTNKGKAHNLAQVITTLVAETRSALAGGRSTVPERKVKGPYDQEITLKDASDYKKYFDISTNTDDKTLCNELTKSSLIAPDIVLVNGNINGECPGEIRFLFKKDLAGEATDLTYTDPETGEKRLCPPDAICTTKGVVCLDKEKHFENGKCQKDCAEAALVCNEAGDPTECKDGYYLNKKQCVACPEHATKCSDGETATACEADFYLRDGQCLECPENATCAGDTDDFVCDKGLEQNEDKDACVVSTLKCSGGAGVGDEYTGANAGLASDGTTQCKCPADQVWNETSCTTPICPEHASTTMSSNSWEAAFKLDSQVEPLLGDMPCYCDDGYESAFGNPSDTFSVGNLQVRRLSIDDFEGENTPEELGNYCRQTKCFTGEVHPKNVTRNFLQQVQSSVNGWCYLSTNTKTTCQGESSDCCIDGGYIQFNGDSEILGTFNGLTFSTIPHDCGEFNNDCPYSVSWVNAYTACSYQGKRMAKFSDLVNAGFCESSNIDAAVCYANALKIQHRNTNFLFILDDNCSDDTPSVCDANPPEYSKYVRVYNPWNEIVLPYGGFRGSGAHRYITWHYSAPLCVSGSPAVTCPTNSMYVTTAPTEGRDQTSTSGCYCNSETPHWFNGTCLAAIPTCSGGAGVADTTVDGVTYSGANAGLASDGTTQCKCPAGQKWDATNGCQAATEGATCTTQDDCGGRNSNYYCNITNYTQTGAWEDYKNTACYDPNGFTATCQRVSNIGHTDATVTGLGSVRRSNSEMSWWSANNWCQAQGRNLIDVEDLQAYRSGTDTLVVAGTTWSHGCAKSKTCASWDESPYSLMWNRTELTGATDGTERYQDKYSTVIKDLRVKFNSYGWFWTKSSVGNTSQNSCFAFVVYLTNGSVHDYGRYYYYSKALCK